MTNARRMQDNIEITQEDGSGIKDFLKIKKLLTNISKHSIQKTCNNREKALVKLLESISLLFRESYHLILDKLIFIEKCSKLNSDKAPWSRWFSAKFY